MEQWIASGRLIDLILLLVAVEAVLFLVLPRFVTWLLRLDLAHAAYLWPTVISGAFLMLTIRLVLTDAAWPLVMIAFAASGLLHVADVVLRLRMRRTHRVGRAAGKAQ